MLFPRYIFPFQGSYRGVPAAIKFVKPVPKTSVFAHEVHIAQHVVHEFLMG